MPRSIILIHGQVQGVGFRPFVYVMAKHHGLAGFVRNQGGGVRIEVEGPQSALTAFLDCLGRDTPVSARINSLHWEETIEQGEHDFRIEASDDSAPDARFIPADLAVCQDCLRELFDPRDRRYQYPFLNCTNCGPRLTIITSAPYDRPRTSMAAFPLCAECRCEYANEHDRRFHAQPMACPHCGPQLSLYDGRGNLLESKNAALQTVAEAIGFGKIVALKSLGGYHLACSAANDESVARLRRLKQRDAKPLAIMVSDLTAARKLCDVSAAEAAILASPASPIVLLRRCTALGAHDGIAASVAPRSNELGIMLPYTPLHHLLLRAVQGHALVMTSGNLSDEPILYTDEDALQQFRGLADLVLTHNRPIVVGCDDSVVRVVDGEALPLRRSRGDAPSPVALPIPCARPLLALGGQQKSTFALAHAGQAFLSQHLGDLDDFKAYQNYCAMIDHYERLFEIEPELLVHDMHPEYASTRYAQQRSASARMKALPRLAVQHHHAHLASCLAEHGRNEQVIGVVFDGTGYGTDGAVWGGEFLLGDCAKFHRAAHFRYVPLAGGEQAVREPWRMGLAYLRDAGEDWLPEWSDVTPAAVRTVRQMLDRLVQAPPTSSVGRLFDAVAALLNLRSHNQYEGQAAAELEWCGAQAGVEQSYRFQVHLPDAGNPLSPWQIDVRPLISDVVADRRRDYSIAVIARRFHATLAAIIVQVCELLRTQTGLQTVALSGGCFVNALLLGDTSQRLAAAGFEVLRHRRVPPGDGGLALGQAAVAVAHQIGHNE